VHCPLDLAGSFFPVSSHRGSPEWTIRRNQHETSLKEPAPGRILTPPRIAAAEFSTCRARMLCLLRYVLGRLLGCLGMVVGLGLVDLGFRLVNRLIRL